MNAQVEVTAPANLQVNCTPVAGAPNYFDLTFSDPAGGQITILRVPRKQVATLGLRAMHGMPTNNVAFQNYQQWHNSLP